VVTEFRQRALSPQEQRRIDRTLYYAALKIRENWENGQATREDDFFDEVVNDRSATEEIYEAILLVARDEPREKKLRFYGNLVANIAFRPEIDRAQANLMIRMGERLSYRQLCLLEIFTRKDSFALRDNHFGGNITNSEAELGEAQWAVMQEIFDLHSQGIVHAAKLIMGSPSPTSIIPGKTDVLGIGKQLRDLMELNDIAREDLEQIATHLR